MVFRRNSSPVGAFFLLYTLCIILFVVGFDTVATEATEITRSRQNNLRWGINQRREENKNGNSHGEINEAKDTRSLIVGGRDALNYPRSVVFLSDRLDDLSCGGSLISPTIVLAAGHCEISLVSDAVFLRYDQSNIGWKDATAPSISSEREIRIPVKEEILHPNYNRLNLENDVMLIVLESSPNNNQIEDTNSPLFHDPVPYMRLHSPYYDQTLDDMVASVDEEKNKKGAMGQQNSNFYAPSGSPKTTDLQLKALGWGHTANGELGTPSEILQEVDLNYVLNDDCKDASEDVRVSYENRITDDMMCTWHSDRDTCNGDSGGPIVWENPNYKKNMDNDFQFLQVGIVSWGEDCADHIFPGVASRVAKAYDWIRDRVCSIDGASAPASFECEGDHTYSPAPSTSPTKWDDAIETKLRSEAMDMIYPVTTVSVAVEIFLDVFSRETSWKLVDTTIGIVVREVPSKTYRFENKIKDVFELIVGNTYVFTIYDDYGDGITNKGSYRIYLVETEDGEDEIGKMLIDATGDFESHRSHVFTVPKLSAFKKKTAALATKRIVTPGKTDGNEALHKRQANRIGQIRDDLFP